MKNILLLSVFMLFLTSCAPKSPPTDFYLLPSPMAIQSNNEVTGIRVGILPISLPSYLQRPQMVLRTEDSANVKIDDFHRWAEDLSAAFQRVLASSLSNSLASSGGIAMPLRMGFPVDYRLSVDVRSFEGSLGQSVTLDAGWTVQQDSKILQEGHFLETIPAGSSFDGIVEAQSKLIQGMAEQIVQKVFLEQNKRNKK